MSYSPRTYVEFLNGLTEGLELTVEDQEVNNSLTIPLVGKELEDYAPHISQGILFLTENFSTGIPFGAVVPTGTLVYDNVTGNVVVYAAGGANVISSETVDLGETSLIPSANKTYDIGSESNRWNEFHTFTLNCGSLYINDFSGESTLLEDTFYVDTGMVLHVGSLNQDVSLNVSLDEINVTLGTSNTIVILDDIELELSPTSNATYVFTGTADANTEMSTSSGIDFLESFSVVADNGFTLTIAVESGTSDNFNGDAGITSVTIDGAATITKLDGGIRNIWLITGDYT